MEINPLKQYFRQPAIYVRLPSNGDFYPAGAIERTPNGEYPVLPMTTIDEITYRTPDALFNGNAVTSVIQSCMPNIKNAWVIPSIDVDTILVAIRVASYGHAMSVSTQCPSCQNTDDYEVDLRTVMDQIQAPDYQSNLTVGDLEIWFAPMSYQQMSTNAMTQFEEQKTIQLLQDSDAPDDQKLVELNAMLKKITTATVKSLAQSIQLVKAPTAQVTDQDQIYEWLINCDRSIFNRIRDRVLELKATSELQPLSINCRSCQKSYQQMMTLDMSNFFVDAS
jgi:hypothetical protein